MKFSKLLFVHTFLENLVVTFILSACANFQHKHNQNAITVTF